MEELEENDEGIPGTEVSFRVDVVHQGAAEPGQEIIIMQTGGVMRGVTYQLDAETPLEAGEKYLLFVSETFDDAYVVLGGSAGTYRLNGKNAYVAVNPDTAPTQRLTESEVDTLTR